MIQLTDNGDKSLYLIRFDDLNFAIIKGKPNRQAKSGEMIPSGNQIIGYYGSVKTALQKSIDIAIKHTPEATQLDLMLQTINDLEKRIEHACATMKAA